MEPRYSLEVEALLSDDRLADRAFEWVEAALGRQQSAGPDGAVIYPTLAPGVFVNELNVCQDYRCRCGWNVVISGRDAERRARLQALVGREPDDRFGSLREVGTRETGNLWMVQIAGTEDLGLDAVISLLL